MKVSFNGGFIKLPNSNIYINPNQITRVFERSGGDTSIHLSDGDYNVTKLSPSEITDACIKAQAENTIVKLHTYTGN